MLKFAFKNMAVRKSRLLLVVLSIVISAGVALLSYNVAQQVSEGIVSTAAYYDMIIGPSGSATQLAMNTMFFTDKPLGTIPYSYVEELQKSGLVNQVVPFTMGDSYNSARIVGTTPAFLEGKPLAQGNMFVEVYEAVVGAEVARMYGLKVGDEIITSHGLNTAAKYDIIIGPSGSATQLAMNTMFFTDKPLGTIPYSVIDELNASGQVNAAIPFSMGDSYNAAPIVGTDPSLLSDKALASGEMFAQALEAVVGADVARAYGLSVGDEIVTSHGLSHAGGTGAAHAEHPLRVVGVLKRTDTAYDNAVFTPVSTVWALHDHGDEEEHEDGDEDEAHAEAGEICAVLVRSKSMSDYAALMSYYGDQSEYLAINPNTVLREVMDNVDLSRRIVYILCLVILVMNLFVVSVIAMLNMYDSRREIALMRLIGVSMGRINQLYLIQNAIAGLCAVALSLLTAHLCLWAIRGFVANMGIVLNATRIYPLEWVILLVVFAVSILPTAVLTRRMARKDSLEH